MAAVPAESGAESVSTASSCMQNKEEPTRLGSPLRPLAGQTRPPIRVGMISLGCAKNLVDAEIMLGSALEWGMEITSPAEDADVLIVNTCAFIDSAKEESIDVILQAHQQRGLNKRPDQKLIVSGCMSQRFARDLQQELPEVDAFIGLDQVSQLGQIIEEVVAGVGDPGGCEPNNSAAGITDAGYNFVSPRPTYIPDYDTPRFRLTPAHSAYVKIAEGCNHPCSFCVIPQMRGKHRSRPIQSIIAEIRGLITEGVREINLISQDTTYYGMDLWPKKAGPRQPIDSAQGPTLAGFLREIQKIEGEFWVRLLYTHPAHWSDELIETIAECDKVARYIDIPLQHIDDAMLERMRRETSRAHIENLVDKLRSGIPDVALRTTFIVGFPGETDEEFETLLNFIRNTRFERLGIFKYSQEEGSRAAKMPNQILLKIKNVRYRMAMSMQQQIAYEVAREKVGSELKLLVDEPHIARSESDAPDIDARVVLSKPASVGEFVWRLITGSRGYDLLA
jgi:ribosomal protein S12 methylthiotransferase